MARQHRDRLDGLYINRLYLNLVLMHVIDGLVGLLLLLSQQALHLGDRDLHADEEQRQQEGDEGYGPDDDPVDPEAGDGVDADDEQLGY